MDHTRIDEGIKRGTHPQRECSNPRDPATGQYLPLLPQDDASIKAAIEAYRDGKTCEQLATDYGVSLQAVYSWLLGDLGGPEHDLLVTQALTARIAKADASLDAAPSPLELARAREQARNSRQDLERRRPRLYGQKQEITLTVQPVLNIAVVVAPQQSVVSDGKRTLLVEQTEPKDDASP